MSADYFIINSESFFTKLTAKLNNIVQIELMLDKACVEIEEFQGQAFDITIKPGFLYAKILNKSPQQVNEMLEKAILALDEIESLEIVKGYINIKLRAKALEQIIEEPLDIQANGVKVKIDFASVNPTGPMHAGHLRMCVIADTLSNLLLLGGFKVVKEYYINDTGGQAAKLVDAIYAQYEKLTQKRDNVESTEYPGEYIAELAEQLTHMELPKQQTEIAEYIRHFATSSLLAEITKTLTALKINHDEYFSEHSMMMQGSIINTLDMLKDKNLTQFIQLDNPIKYQKTSKQACVYALKTSTGPKALTKDNQEHTYLLADIALHLKRAQESDWIIDCFGADHAEHGKTLVEIMSLLTDAKLSIKTCQMVAFVKNGRQFKMSKRAGNYITAQDIIDAVGCDIIRTQMLSRTANSQMELDVVKVMQLDENSPLFYMQYAHARCCSLLAKNCSSIGALDDVRKLIIKMGFYHHALKTAIKTLEPHHFFTYILDLAQIFHKHWNLNIKLTEYKQVISRLQSLLEIGLNAMGLTACKHMN